MVFVKVTPHLQRAIEEAAPVVPEAEEYLKDAKDLLAVTENGALLSEAERDSMHLVPLSLVRAICRHKKISTESLLVPRSPPTADDNGDDYVVVDTPTKEQNAASSSSAPSSSSSSCTLVMLRKKPQMSESKLAMRHRMKQIDRLVEEREYAAMTHGVNTTALEKAQLAAGGAKPQGKETMATFLRDIGVGIDVRLMSLAGGVVGYYLCWSRGQATDTCLVGAAIGAIAMMFVDAALLIFRMSHEDTIDKKKKAKQQRGLAAAPRKRNNAAPSSSSELKPLKKGKSKSE